MEKMTPRLLLLFQCMLSINLSVPHCFASSETTGSHSAASSKTQEYISEERVQPRRAQAEWALRHKRVDEAISLFQQLIETDAEDDLDLHILYAEALERKLQNTQVEEPSLYNKCVNEWLLVLRNSCGEEKGLNFKGIGIPGISGNYFADERQSKARAHLLALTGSLPKLWETNQRFLKRVRRSAETSVSAKLVPRE